MAWVDLQHTRRQIRRAGQVLRALDPNAPLEDLDETRVLDNWRAAHAEPLNSAQMGLRSRLDTIGRRGDVSQRLKRRRAILTKLRREPTMQLDTMEDIAGCRVVLEGGLQDVYELARQWRRTARGRVRRERDYIADPRATGYRALHLVVLYGSFKVEVQLRTRAQHAWAVLVERISARTGLDLKNGAGPASVVDGLRDLANQIAAVDSAGVILGPEVFRQLERILLE
ncbi:MAG: hypothetical protein FJW79_03955 [Actinobacteria bacterium]|nr:hypothetical protein [Actinomycetota bacterium]